MGFTLLADCQAQWWPCPAGGYGGPAEAIATGGLWRPSVLLLGQAKEGAQGPAA